MNNPLSFSSIKLDLFTQDGMHLKAASGFVIEAENQYFLTTNWHVLSGGDIFTEPSQEPAMKPYTLKTSVYMYAGEDKNVGPFFRGNWRKITLPLYNDHDEPNWIEPRPNKQGQPITDIAALPLRWDRDWTLLTGRMMGNIQNVGYWSKVLAIPLSAVNTDVEYGPSDNVAVIGYPINWSPAGSDKSSSAFWRTSSIASELMEPGRTQANIFFIDPCAPDGMTGSPVVGMKNGVMRLLGVYSDSSTTKFGANAGMVWEAWRIKELIAAY